MIKISRLKVLPKLDESDLTAHSWKEYKLAFNRLNTVMNKYPDVWEITYDGTVVFIAGIGTPSFIGRGAELWFLCFRSFLRHKKSLVRFLKKALSKLIKIYRRMFVYVSKEFTDGNKFIQLLGFSFSGETLMADNTLSNVYSKVG